MILLSGRSLTPARKVPVESMSLQLKERDSSATITPADMTGIQVNSWLKDETDPGAGIVWRVKSIQQAYATQTPTVQLEHAVSTLKDTILFGEHKAAQITGNSKATTCTARQAVMYILRKQSDWALGEFDYANVSNPYKFDGDTLYDCLETISGSLQDAWWSYDFSTYPFKLNITQKPSGVGSEMRASRNLKTLTRTIDKSGMFTRFYPIGANDLHIDGDYVQKNTDLYGVVSKVETDQSIDTKAELTRWANERLADHAEPTVTTEVEGVELAADTGVSLDSMKLGRLCRIPLPEYGTTITERIVALTYSDKVHQPQVFKATLSNTKTDITKIVADALKKGGRGGRAAARREKQDLAWFEDTNDHVSMCAIGIIGVDAKGEPNWIRLTEVTADGEGLHSTVQSIQNGQLVQQTRLEQNERSIGMVVETSPDGKTKIKAAEITASINNGSTNIKLKADHIDIDGLVEKLETRTLGVGGLHVEGWANFLKPAYFEAGLSSDEPISALAFEVGNQTLNVANATVDGNVLTITYVNGSKVNFSKATTLSGQWSGTTAAGKSYKVTAAPQGTVLYSPSLDGMARRNDKTWADNKQSFTQTIYVYDEDGTDLYEENIAFSTGDSYEAGAESVTVDTVAAPTNRTNSSFTVTATASNGETKTRTYYLVQRGSYIYVTQGSATIGANYTVARIIYTEE